MSSSHRSPRRRNPRVDPGQRARLLAAFARSGLSAAAFARQHGFHYTTFCRWRSRQAQAQPTPAFVEVELPAATASAELTIELGTHARLRLHSPGQLALAVRLLQALNPPAAC